MRSPAASGVSVWRLLGTISPLRSTAIRLPSSASSRIRSATVAPFPQTRAYVEKVIGAITRGEQIEVTGNLPNGRIVRVVNCPKADGGWVATHEDITEHRHLEQRLRRIHSRSVPGPRTQRQYPLHPPSRRPHAGHACSPTSTCCPSAR